MLEGIVAYNRPQSRYAWRGSAIVILDNEGCAGDAPLSGFYVRETRFLRDLKFEVDHERPSFCSSANVAPNRLEFAYIHPEGSEGTGEHNGLLYRTLDLMVSLIVHPASLEVVLDITNRFQERVQTGIGWNLSADYTGLTESASGKREVNASVTDSAGENEVFFRFDHPRLPFQTQIRTEGGLQWRWDGRRLSTTLSIARQETVTLRLWVQAIDFQDPISSQEEQRREERVEKWLQSTAKLSGGAESVLMQLTNNAVRDLGSLALLEGQEDEWLTPAAGVPLFLNLWARDALTTGWQAAAFDGGDMIRSTLARLARLQGKTVDPTRDEQPGRIINRVQRNPATRLGNHPFDRFYPDFASPFMFIIALGQLFAWTGDKSALQQHWEVVEGILEWAEKFGDRDGDGYLEYLTASPQGPRHQGWKDSEIAVVYEDGRHVEPPIAVCEIQGYYYAALEFAAVFAVVLGHPRQGRAIWSRAKELKQRFNRDFWIEEEGYVGFGLDANKRLIRSITSNAAQCLATGIVTDEHSPALVARMFQPDLFSGWGIRTLSTRNAAYNPLSYHLGSVWPVENATILLGLRRYGFITEAEKLGRALYQLAMLWDEYRTPECVGGYPRDGRAHPGAFVNANSPQAWNQSVFPMLVQSLLGMRALATLNLLLVDPLLPEWCPELRLEGIRVGDGRISLRFFRHKDGKSDFETIAKEGSVHVMRQPPLDALSVGIWDRFGALVKGILPF